MFSSSHLGDLEPNQSSQRSSGGCCETGSGLVSFFLFRFRGVGMSCVVPRCVGRDAPDSAACLHPGHFLTQGYCYGHAGWKESWCRRHGEWSTVSDLVDDFPCGLHSHGQTYDRGGSWAIVHGGHDHANEIVILNVRLVRAYGEGPLKYS